jgi:hypothetical protein
MVFLDKSRSKFPAVLSSHAIFDFHTLQDENNFNSSNNTLALKQNIPLFHKKLPGNKISSRNLVFFGFSRKESTSSPCAFNIAISRFRLVGIIPKVEDNKSF